MTISPSELLRQEVHIVPAHPGFNRITQVHGEGFEVVDVQRMPVHAWCVEIRIFLHRDGLQHTESTTTPISVGTNCGLYDNWALEYPDGSCYPPFAPPRARMLASAAKLLQHWQEEPQAQTSEDAIEDEAW